MKKLSEFVTVNIFSVLLYWMILFTIMYTVFGDLLLMIGISIFRNAGVWVLFFVIPVIYSIPAIFYCLQKKRAKKFLMATHYLGIAILLFGIGLSFSLGIIFGVLSNLVILQVLCCFTIFTHITLLILCSVQMD